MKTLNYKTAQQRALGEVLRILGECTAEKQPTAELLSTMEGLLGGLGKNGDYGEVKERLEQAENLLKLLQAQRISGSSHRGV